MPADLESFQTRRMADEETHLNQEQARRCLRYYNEIGQVILTPEPLGVDAVFHRPPLGPARCGKRSTAGGRGHRKSASDAARARRFALCWQAYQLRLQGLSVRVIAARLGVGKTVCGGWLRGVPALRAEVDAILRETAEWARSVEADLGLD